MRYELLSSLFQTFWLSLAFNADAVASNLAIHRRDAAPAIKTSITIRDHHGINITPSFKIMVNHQAQTLLSSNNTTNSTLHDRQTSFGRLINSCPPGQIFLESHCLAEAGVQGSVQKYVYTCRQIFNRNTAVAGARTSATFPRYRIREGHCDAMEICLDVVSAQKPSVATASCNRVEIFEEWQLTKDGVFKPMVDGEVFRPLMSMYGVLSQTDESTPVEADSLEVDAWSRAGEGSSTGSGSQVQSQKCRDCVDIQLDKLNPQTDSLKIEATLMNGISTAAVGGMLWLTLVTAG